MLVDDHEIVREGLAELLARDPEVEVVATAGNGREAVRLALEHRPEAIVMDVRMPGLNGADATREILQRHPDCRVALSAHCDRHHIADMFEAGASGYVLKHHSFREISTALDAVMAGDVYVSPGCSTVMVRDYIDRVRGDGGPKGGNAQLTSREREVLQLIAEGHTTREIAALMHLSVKTVESHRHRISEKLDIFSVAGLVKYALRIGLTSIDH